ncbi:ATP-binding protein [Anaeromyxobacter sp. Fw109-5]|uniref:hybrid sensor histidine kinase/response regulator n=1 Tax=Anaeromyxobacter sp. (strain Fw109-5) TaxID=404589 RepID=UPI000158A665|nr:ATP-binding protein [Anaeromyxobacter sp. Fw109-5]ABS27129.1 PAS/PAC sensor hybrid histidine kinase [Anaeromyxobacter sp. Fw109-5]
MRSNGGTAADGLADALFEEAGAGLCLVSASGKVLRANREWLRVTGHLEGEALGREVAELLPWDRALSRALDEPLSAGERRELPRRPRRVNGREVWWEGRVTGVALEGGTGRLLALRDVTAEAVPGPFRDAGARYRRLFDELREHVFVYTVVRDGAGLVIDWILADANHQALALLGAPLERVAGRRASELFGAAALAEQLAASREVMATGRGLTFERRFAWDGRHYLTSLFPLDHWNLVAAGIDTTERVAAEEALRAEDRRKSEFLAMLSHELRNPLAPMRTAVAVLERAAPGAPEASRARAAITRQTEHLARLVDDLLDVTRIAHGKIRLRTERLDLAALVRCTADDHRDLLAASGVALRVTGAVEPLPILGDRTRLEQVVGNLLANAGKFTRRGGNVTVTLGRERDRAVFSVADDGEGIDPELVPRLFAPFVQADDGLDRPRGGLGLGLYLVRSLVELHGGSVAVRSGGSGRGAEFTVGLPLVEEARAPEPTRDPLSGKGPRRVLVIEDNPDAAEMLRDLLAGAAHEVEVAPDGRQGVARARALRPDLVLCDIGLPVMDGYEVARTLRGDPDLSATLLVALSGYAMPDDVAKAAQAGFDRHLAKPVSLSELGAVLAAAARSV